MVIFRKFRTKCQKKFILVVPEGDISIFQAKSTRLLEDYCKKKLKKSAKEYNLSLQFIAQCLWGCRNMGNIKISFLPDLAGISETGICHLGGKETRYPKDKDAMQSKVCLPLFCSLMLLPFVYQAVL